MLLLDKVALQHEHSNWSAFLPYVENCDCLTKFFERIKKYSCVVDSCEKKYSCKITIYSCEKKITVVKFVITVVNLR